jgi:hypothetical protein
MTLKNLTPTKLRLALSIGLFLTLIAAGAIFYFANNSLRNTATSVSHKVADAEASRNSIANLKKVEKFLAEQNDTIERVNSIVADSQSYQYQDQIILDLNAYAAKAGISITNFDFVATTAAAPAATATPPGATVPPAGASAPTVNVKSTTVSITVDNPVDYVKLLKFIKSIEQNLTKMQISKVSLSKGAAPNEVTTDSLAIEIYVR